MFVQVITGRTSDADALHERLEVWQRDLMPGAIGYLGSTGGCTAQGDCILVARFASADAARRNSERPEQGAWWKETAKCFVGEPTFHDSEEIAVMQHGDLDRAHFVQVMEGHVTDKARARALEDRSDEALATARPDLLGAVTAYYDDDGYTSIAYFTSEDDARKAESQEIPSEMAEELGEWQQVMHVERYLDLRDPWLVDA